MKLVKKYITNNMHYENNKLINVKGFVIHSVGTPQPNPNVFINNWNNPISRYPAQIVIGTDKAYEVLPCMDTPGKAVLSWHVGSANGYTIGIEMTEPSSIRYTNGSNFIDLNREKTEAHVLATYRNAVDILAQCCKFHNLNPLDDGVIMSHSECYKRGIGTNHGDVEHLWDRFKLSMDQFRKDIYNAMNGDCGSFLVKVNISDLNIRTGPSVNNMRIGYIQTGVYTIVEVRRNWGRLKSKQVYKGKLVDAWICLDYTTKLRQAIQNR